jgi:hypothetical protein
MPFLAFPDISPYQNYAHCYWRVKDVDALYAEYRLKISPAVCASFLSLIPMGTLSGLAGRSIRGTPHCDWPECVVILPLQSKKQSTGVSAKR